MVRYRISPSALVQEVISEMVILDLHRGTYFELNETGSAILRNLRETGDPEQALTLILREYDVNRETIREDLQDLLNKLENNGLIEKISN